MNADFFSEPHNAAESTRQALLQRISDDTNLPALGSAISQVIHLASSSDEAVRNLAHFVLSDAALTQKILRLANTVAYRTAAGAPVTTISRAIFLLGFDAVKTSALAMLLVDGMTGKQALAVRKELSNALCASIVGRELARRSHFKDSEEAAVAALFKNFGRLLVAAHDHARYAEIAALVEQDGLSPARASLQVIGCTFEALAEAVLREWQIPDSIVKALAPIPAGALKPAKSRTEWIAQVAAFSTTAAALIGRVSDGGGEAASAALVARYGAALELDLDGISTLLATVAAQSRVLTHTSDLNGDEQDDASAVDEPDLLPPNSGVDAPPAVPDTLKLPAGLFMLAEPELAMGIEPSHPSGKPFNTRELLLAGVQDVTEMMASGRMKMNDLMLLALETLYRSMGFRFATICARDLKSGLYRARLSLGEQHQARQQQFSFASDGGRDLFTLALANNADLVISDATAANIADLIPVWHRQLLPDARSFVVLPLLVRDKPVGLFYGDRVLPAPEGVPVDESALIKMLKGQMIAALTPR